VVFGASEEFPPDVERAYSSAKRLIASFLCCSSLSLRTLAVTPISEPRSRSIELRRAYVEAMFRASYVSAVRLRGVGGFDVLNFKLTISAKEQEVVDRTFLRS